LVKDLADDSVTIQRQLKVSKERLLYSDSLIDMVHQGNVLNKTGPVKVSAEIYSWLC